MIDPTKRCPTVCLAALLSLASLLPVQLQASDTLTGEIAGRVLDLKEGTPLEGCLIELLNVDRGWSRQRQVDADGNFIFVQVEPGNYRITASKAGYLSRTAIDILIQLGQTKVVIPPFRLRPLVPPIARVVTAFSERVKTLAIDLTAPAPPPAEITSLVASESTTMVSLRDGTRRSNFDSTLIEALPLKGARTFDQLALFAPGVFRVPTSSAEGPAVGIGIGSPGQFSVNGLRARSNNFTVDGSDNNDADIGVRRQGFVSLVPQTIESIQDVQIATAVFPAESGRNSASIVNVVSRSGASSVHGTLYGFFNGGGLNARDSFETRYDDKVNLGAEYGGSFNRSDARRSQIGGTLSGPLVPRKLFYFGSAELLRNSGIALKHFVVPSTSERGLRMHDYDTDPDTTFIPVDSLDRFLGITVPSWSADAGQEVFSLYPLPNNPSGPFGGYTYSESRHYDGNGGIGSFKMDWYVSRLNSLFARYNFTQDQALIPFTSEAIHSSIDTDTRTQDIALFLNTSGSRIANALRASYGRTRLAFPSDRGDSLLFGSAWNPSSKIPQTSIQTRYGTFGPFGATGPVGQLVIVPYSPVGVDVLNFPQGRVDNTYQLADSITWLRTRHTVKFGFDFRHSQLNSFSDRNSRPFLLFGYGKVDDACVRNYDCPFAPLKEGLPDDTLRGTDLASLGGHAGFLQTISTNPAADTTIGLRLSQLDLFLQDDWRVTPNFAVNVGTRYELHSVPAEVNGKIEKTFSTTADQFPRLPATGTPEEVDSINKWNTSFDASVAALREFWNGRQQIYGPDRNNFAPRISFAWDPSGTGRSVIRGGYGVNFDVNLGASTSQSRNVFPTFVPVNLDLNFNASSSQPRGRYLNSTSFFEFLPSRDGKKLIQPGTLNVFNLNDEFATAIGSLLTQSIDMVNRQAVRSSNGIAFTLPVKNLETGYGQQFVLSAERQIRNELVVSLAYVGTRGIKLPRFTTPNGGFISIPVMGGGNNFDELRDLPPVPSGVGEGRPNSNLGAFTQIENSASSTYHSMQLSVERRLRRGFQFRSQWTWSHAIDDVSDQFAGRAFFSLPQNGARLDLEKASANFDVRHRVTGFLVWNLPTWRDAGWSRDWKAALTFEGQTGQPYTVNTAMDRNRDGNLTDRLDSVRGLILSPGSPQPVRLADGVDPSTLVAKELQSGEVGRNTFRIGAFTNVDAALSRSFPFGESSTIDLRMEVFNLFNHGSPGVPVRILESPGFGRSFDNQIPSRSIRFVLKLAF